MNNNILSKEISYALRHAPQKYGLTLDESGCVNLNDLIQALRKRPKFRGLELKDIETMIQSSEKKRFEIKESKIRALYGHSIAEVVARSPEKPPDVLYHGTANRYMPSIMKTGLLPKGRQHVHLSEDAETAIAVGKRRDSQPVILVIDSKKAYDSGVAFYNAGDGI